MQMHNEISPLNTRPCIVDDDENLCNAGDACATENTVFVGDRRCLS